MMSSKDKVISLNDYRRRRNGLDKPLFSKPTNIVIEDPNNPEKYGEYAVVCNLVHEDRQFLAMEREDQEEDRYTMVEGIVENGSLVRVEPIAEDEYDEIESKFSRIFAQF
ncbi:hypothetical protein [Aquibacillus sediminis]|uniref:hypothetical protein n=1 Tax=Aquibacillus sediminis TaxID=2574734 RepID=UPI0011093DFA|nr:hypothetical protein [Aquibacillus sediminis]